MQVCRGRAKIKQNHLTMKVSDSIIVCPFSIARDQQEKAPYGFESIPGRGASQGYRQVAKVETKHLATGDYSIIGLEDRVVVERKSLVDLYGTLGKGRERFEREFERMTAMDFANVVIEADWREIIRPDDPAVVERKALDVLQAAILGDESEILGREHLQAMEVVGRGFVQRWAWMEKKHRSAWRSQMNPRSIWGTIAAWSLRYPKVRWWTMGSRRIAELWTFELLEQYWRASQHEPGESGKVDV
jgi:hypothetical protein